MEQTYDVVVCGGGLSGLCLARQLSFNAKKLRVLVLDALRPPLPEAAFKVGESTIEAGAYYYSEVLDLKDHLVSEHCEKLGLRYFFAGASAANELESRPEYGARRYLPAPSYQIDRGKFESHLRGLVQTSGAEIQEGALVRDIAVADPTHSVTWSKDGITQTVRCRWVIDAMGRKRWLQKKFGLGKRGTGVFSSAWWRVKGRLRVTDFVSGANRDWHGRVEVDRWYSTNHLMGKDYWVWLIPLAPNVTSVGIVASEATHPFSGYSTYARATKWLSVHEPDLQRALIGATILDFKALRNYSYSSGQVFSVDRWACTGEAAGFADPYYSVGSNLIAFGNGFINELVNLDKTNCLTNGYVDYANSYFLNLLNSLTENIHSAYPFLDNGPIIALKTIWDYYIGWCITDPQYYHDLYLDPRQASAVSAAGSHITAAQVRMRSFFRDWAEKGSTLTFSYIDYIDDLPTLRRLHTRSLPPKQTKFKRVFEMIRENLEHVEALAVVIFRLAVDDVLPDHAGRVAQHPWINVAAISLRPEKWEEDGIFRPRTNPIDIAPLDQEIRALFTRTAGDSRVTPMR